MGQAQEAGGHRRQELDGQCRTRAAQHCSSNGKRQQASQRRLLCPTLPLPLPASRLTMSRGNELHAALGKGACRQALCLSINWELTR